MREEGGEGRRGLSGNVAEKAFCLKSAHASPCFNSDMTLYMARCVLFSVNRITKYRIYDVEF